MERRAVKQPFSISKYGACASGVLVLTILLAVTLRWAGHRAVEEDVMQPECHWEYEFTPEGGALLAYPTRKGEWYVLRWEERKLGLPLADTVYKIDREDNRVIYWRPYAAVSTNFRSRQIVFRATSDQRHVRFLAAPAGVLSIRNVSIARCRAWAAVAMRFWYCVIALGVAGVIIAMRKWMLRSIRAIVGWYGRLQVHTKWVVSAGAFVIAHCSLMMPLAVRVARNAGETGRESALWHVLGLAPAIAGIMYAIGWPISVWLLREQRRYACELLLAVGMGFVVLMCTYSMSIMGVRSHVVGLAIVTYLVVSWSTLLRRGVYPAPPDIGAVTVVLSVIVLLSVLSKPLQYERDVWPSAMHNADITVYTTESIALREMSALELCQISLKQEEPSYLAYKADTIRGLPFGVRYSRVSDATEHLVAVLSWILCTRPEHILGMYTCCVLPLLILAGSGTIRVVYPMQPVHLLFLVLSMATCFPLIYLSRDAYFNNLHGLVLSAMLVVLGSDAIQRGNMRLATAAGLCGAALIMSFIVIAPLVVAVLLSYTVFVWIVRLIWRQRAKLTRAFAALAVLAVTCIAVAPHATYFLLCDIWQGAFGSKLFIARPPYPQRTWTLAGGFVGDWTEVLAMPSVAYYYQQITAVATVCGILGIMLWLWKQAAWRVRGISTASIAVTCGAVLWAYAYDTSRYAYFKNLVTAALVMSVCATCAWTSIASKRGKTISGTVSLMLLAMWMCARLASIPLALTVTRPVNVLNEKVASVSEVSQLLPRDACIKIAVNDYVYTPMLHAYLRHFVLRSDNQVGYSVRTLPGDDYNYVLSSTPIPSLQEVWNNGYYWLYSTNRACVEVQSNP